MRWRVPSCFLPPLSALLKRFERVILRLFEKHGIQHLGFWTVVIGESNNDLHLMLQWESLADRERSHIRRSLAKAIAKCRRAFIRGIRTAGSPLSEVVSLARFRIRRAPSGSSGGRMPSEIVRTLVEAGGIEPPSEDLPVSVTTRLFRDLISSPGRPRTGCPSTSQLKFRSVAQSANRELLAH